MTLSKINFHRANLPPPLTESELPYPIPMRPADMQRFTSLCRTLRTSPGETFRELLSAGERLAYRAQTGRELFPAPTDFLVARGMIWVKVSRLLQAVKKTIGHALFKQEYRKIMIQHLRSCIEMYPSDENIVVPHNPLMMDLEDARYYLTFGIKRNRATADVLFKKLHVWGKMINALRRVSPIYESSGYDAQAHLLQDFSSQPGMWEMIEAFDPPTLEADIRYTRPELPKDRDGLELDRVRDGTEFMGMYKERRGRPKKTSPRAAETRNNGGPERRPNNDE